MAEFIRGKPKSRFRGIKLTDGELSFASAGYNLTFAQATLTASGTITIPAATDVTLLTTANVTAGTIQLGNAITTGAIGGNSTQTGTVALTGLGMDDVVVVTRQETNTDFLSITSAFPSAANILGLVYVNHGSVSIADIGTMVIGYLRYSP